MPSETLDRPVASTSTPRPAPPEAPRGRGRAVHLAWFAAGCVAAFAVPFALSDLLRLPPDGYYLAYFAFVGLLLAAYGRATGVDWAGTFRRGWLPSLALGALATAFVVGNVLADPATPGPTGPALAFAVLWRGLAYGVADALLLSAFPLLVALALFGGRPDGLARRAGLAAVVLALSMVITATYHAGYAQYRAHGMARDGLGGPLVGNAVITLPAALGANPLGALVAHAAMHVAAVVHASESAVFLPPRTERRP